MADLEANFMHLQLMHESLSRFSESFASFLYGLNMNAFCVDFPEVRDVMWYPSLLLPSPITSHRPRFLNHSEEQSNGKPRKVIRLRRTDHSSEINDEDAELEMEQMRPTNEAETTFM